MPTIQGTDDFSNVVAGSYDAFFNVDGVDPSGVTSPAYLNQPNSLRISPTGSNEGVRKNITGSPTRGWTAFPFQISTAPSSGQGILRLHSNTTNINASISITSGLVINAFIGAGGAANGPTLAVNTWYWIEAIYNVITTTHTLLWRVNGVDQTSATVAGTALDSVTYSQLFSTSGDAPWYTGGYWGWGTAASDSDWQGEPVELPLSNTFEGGSDETTISTANSGGTSGDALTSISIGAGNAFVFDTARAAHGGVSSRMDLANNPATVDQIGWSFWPINPEIWGYFYIYLTGTWTGPSVLRIASFDNAGAAVGRIVLGRDSPVIQVSDQNFAGAATTTGAMTYNAWYRIGWRVLCSPTAGEIEARIYLGDSATPITDGTCVTDSVRDTDTAMTSVTIGNTSAWSGGVFSGWYDTFNVNITGDFGPYSVGRVGYQRLVGPQLLPSTAATLYTVPTGMRATIRHVYINNPTGSTVQATLSIGADAAGTRIVEVPILAGQTLDIRRSVFRALEAGEIIQGVAGTASALAIVIDGYLQSV